MAQRLHRFLASENSAGVILMAATILGLLAANSFFSPIYYSFFNPLTFAINDGLMTFFFLLAGAEIKREILTGELSSREKLLQPLCAALGGMIVPALVFVSINANSPESLKGCAIPAATDIAFALGVLSLLGKNVPAGLKIFLTAVAILDDLGAILIIALFYTAQIDMICLGFSAVIVALMVLLNRQGNSAAGYYLILGAGLWFCFYKTGIHPTLAGVITAFCIPHSGLKKLEKILHGPVLFAVIPIFALANTGLDLRSLEIKDALNPLPFGIIAGLLIGKPLGIMAGIFLGHITGIARINPGTRWSHYIVIACLCGVGFTMALFIGETAFSSEEKLNHVRLGVMTGSFLAAMAGLMVGKIVFRPDQTKS